MNLGGLLRTRFTLALALCAVLWSNPSFAAMLCRAPQCSLTAMRTQQPYAAVARPVESTTSRVSDATPCCPMHARNPKRGADDLACCNIDNAATPAQASSSRAGQKRLAVTAAQGFHAVPTLGHSPLRAAETAALYVKPVTQKKTDLRI